MFDSIFWDFVDGGKEFSAVDTADLGLITQRVLFGLGKISLFLCLVPGAYIKVYAFHSKGTSTSDKSQQGISHCAVFL